MLYIWIISSNFDLNQAIRVSHSLNVCGSNCVQSLPNYMSLHWEQVVIQEARSHCDSIANILEEMKSDPDGNGGSGSGIEVTTGCQSYKTRLLRRRRLVKIS